MQFIKLMQSGQGVGFQSWQVFNVTVTYMYLWEALGRGRGLFQKVSNTCGHVDTLDRDCANSFMPLCEDDEIVMFFLITFMI